MRIDLVQFTDLHCLGARRTGSGMAQKGASMATGFMVTGRDERLVARLATSVGHKPRIELGITGFATETKVVFGNGINGVLVSTLRAKT